MGQPAPRQSACLLYVIYDRTSDYPNEFVCRRWGADGQTLDPGEPFARGGTSGEVRRALPPGLVKLMPWEKDDPAILEIWV